MKKYIYWPMLIVSAVTAFSFVQNKVVAGNYDARPTMAEDFGKMTGRKAGDKQQLWRTSWTAFAQRLSALLAVEVSLSALKTASKGDNLPAITPKSVKQEFDDMPVEWEGVVQEIYPPGNPGYRLAMQPTPIRFMDGGQLTMDSLKVFPLGDNKTLWNSVKIGDKVVFQTTLKGNAMFGVVVVMHAAGGFDKNLYGNGVSSETPWLWSLRKMPNYSRSRPGNRMM